MNWEVVFLLVQTSMFTRLKKNIHKIVTEQETYRDQEPLKYFSSLCIDSVEIPDLKFEF